MFALTLWGGYIRPAAAAAAAAAQGANYFYSLWMHRAQEKFQFSSNSVVTEMAAAKGASRLHVITIQNGGGKSQL